MVLPWQTASSPRSAEGMDGSEIKDQDGKLLLTVFADSEFMRLLNIGHRVTRCIGKCDNFCSRRLCLEQERRKIHRSHGVLYRTEHFSAGRLDHLGHLGFPELLTGNADRAQLHLTTRCYSCYYLVLMFW